MSSELFIIGFILLFLTILVGLSFLAKYMANTTMTPVKNRADEFKIVPLKQGKAVELPLTRETNVDGKYSLYFSNGFGHARIGRIISRNLRNNTLIREVEYISKGDFMSAVGGSWAGYIWDNPSELNLQYEDIQIETENGIAPSWFIPANYKQISKICAIMVHGRGASKAEGLRAVKVLYEEGVDTLLINYRNDFNGPKISNGVYGLGYTEWKDVEASIKYMLKKGAEKIILFGWSMGGSIAIETYIQSSFKKNIFALVLDAPALDWENILRKQAKKHKIPEFVGTVATYILSILLKSLIRREIGHTYFFSIKSLKWVDKINRIKIPMLIIHSVDDTYVPYEPSENLAKKIPHIISYRKSYGAQHTKEWNVDPEYCNMTLKIWLRNLKFQD